MKYARVMCVTLAIVGLGLSQGLALAADEAPKGTPVVVTGTNYCLETTIHPDSAQSALNASRHSLKVAEAKDEAGVAIEDLAGKTLHYLHSDSSAPLSSDSKYFDKTVTITGTLYKDEAAIEVATIELAEGQSDDPGAPEVTPDDFDFSAGGSSASKRRAPAR